MTDPAAVLGDAERLAVLRAARLLNAEPEEPFEGVTRLAREVVGVPVALVTIVDAERQVFKSSRGLPEPWRSRGETPLSHSFCQHVVLRGERLVVEDARQHPELRDNPAIPDLGVVAYAGVPIVTPHGHRLGSIAAIHTEPRAWSERDVWLLEQLAQFVSLEIEARLAGHARAEEARTRQRLEQELLQAQKLEAVGQLAGGVAHDFNNLLTGILGYTDLLLEDATCGPDAREYAAEIRRSAERAAALVRELLAVGRRQLLAPRELSLNSVVDDALPALRERMPADVAIETRLEPAPWPVRADPKQLERALVNLVVNAAQAMRHPPEGGGRIEISTSNRALAHEHRDGDVVPPGEYAVLAVRDSGHGIPPEVLPHIFNPFFTTRAVGEGTGLGLASVYGAIKQSGGHIMVESSPGRGTTFEILLPRAGTSAP